MGKSLPSRNGLPTLLALTMCIAVLGGSAAAICNAGDQRALLAFKAQLLDPRNALAAWKGSSDCCTWLGVRCDGRGRVTALWLSSYGFDGLPEGYQLKVRKGVQGAGASLGNLKELVELSLEKIGFGFAHPIPPQITTLPKLTRLSLLTCEFIGKIPSSIGKLSQLSELIIHDNRHTGPAIPDSFGNLKFLRTLSLINNTLTSIGSPKITQLKNLESINLENNRISGRIPKWLGGLTLVSPIISSLILSQNPLTGPIPCELCNIKGLQSLYIANTQVTSIPAQIGNCRNLRTLYLVNNKLRGSLPSGMGKMKKLQLLALGSDTQHNNRLTGTLPAALGDLPDLGNFDIANNKFHGRIPANYGPFSLIKVPAEMTRFQGNDLSGPIPKDMRDVPIDRFRPGNPRLCGTPLPACN